MRPLIRVVRVRPTLATWPFSSVTRDPHRVLHSQQVLGYMPSGLVMEKSSRTQANGKS